MAVQDSVRFTYHSKKTKMSFKLDIKINALIGSLLASACFIYLSIYLFLYPNLGLFIAFENQACMQPVHVCWKVKFHQNTVSISSVIFI